MSYKTTFSLSYLESTMLIVADTSQIFVELMFNISAYSIVASIQREFNCKRILDVFRSLKLHHISITLFSFSKVFLKDAYK